MYIASLLLQYQTTYINGSPQNTFVPGVVELAERQGVFIGGDDFKSGQTKVKSVLVDFLVSAGIKVAIITIVQLNVSLFPLLHSLLQLLHIIILGIMMGKTFQHQSNLDQRRLESFLCVMNER